MSNWDFYTSFNVSAREFIGMLTKFERGKSKAKTNRKTQVFDNVLITPTTTHIDLVKVVQNLKVTGKIKKVFFDCGGYDVQLKSITYKQMQEKVFEKFLAHTWADIYCLPDNPLISGDTPEQVKDKVNTTVSGSIELYEKLPTQIQKNAMPVVIGHTKSDIDFCIDQYKKNMDNVKYMGFGAWATKQGSPSINLVNVQTLRLFAHASKRLEQSNTKLHAFGIASSPAIALLLALGAHSIDSAAWMIAGGYGLIYMPLKSVSAISTGHMRYNSSHKHMSKKEFQNLKKHTGHECPFCETYEHLAHDRMNRLLHNLCVLCNIAPYDAILHEHILRNTSKKFYGITKKLGIAL